MHGGCTRPAIGSAHHKPNSVRSKPPMRIADGKCEIGHVWKSALIAPLRIPAATRPDLQKMVRRSVRPCGKSVPSRLHGSHRIRSKNTDQVQNETGNNEAAGVAADPANSRRTSIRAFSSR